MSAGSATIDILLERIIDTLEGRSGPAEQLIVIGWADWSEEEWKAERERIESEAIEKARAAGRMFRCGVVVRVTKCRQMPELEVDVDLQRTQHEMRRDLEQLTP